MYRKSPGEFYAVPEVGAAILHRAARLFVISELVGYGRIQACDHRYEFVSESTPELNLLWLRLQRCLGYGGSSLQMCVIASACWCCPSANCGIDGFPLYTGQAMTARRPRWFVKLCVVVQVRVRVCLLLSCANIVLGSCTCPVMRSLLRSHQVRSLSMFFQFQLKTIFLGNVFGDSKNTNMLVPPRST